MPHVHTRRTRVAAAITCIFFLVLQCVVDAHPQPQINCSKTCVAQNCDTVGIRYGKFCGIGWTGCPGEKPCDALDECCKLHDECVGKKGMTDVKCHEKFKSCMKKVRKSGKIGFSQDCPYETAMPTMMQGMDMAILLGKFGNRNFELYKDDHNHLT
ncbi:probable phospholipase A2 homolog 1 [Magnolia sinica]|uniref:probable phospholipase A2 homolog 1 n=1 Tax=Magnolia sinica TaxID=86752 RepID=UPI00265B6184|nr:probable phospholipase A2 homolog 1 [Magnolia sinica]